MKRAEAPSTRLRPTNRRKTTTSRRCPCGSRAGLVRFPSAARRDRSYHFRRRWQNLSRVGRYSCCSLLVAYLSQGKITGRVLWPPARQDAMRAGRDEMQETVVFLRHAVLHLGAWAQYPDTSCFLASGCCWHRSATDVDRPRAAVMPRTSRSELSALRLSLLAARVELR